MNFYLYSSVDPIIELSSGMNFAPFNGSYPGIAKHFANAGLDPANNHWKEVFDFNDEAKTGDHWSLISAGDREAEWSITVRSSAFYHARVPVHGIVNIAISCAALSNTMFSPSRV
jgi:hypothetical protein